MAPKKQATTTTDANGSGPTGPAQPTTAPRTRMTEAERLAHLEAKEAESRKKVSEADKLRLQLAFKHAAKASGDVRVVDDVKDVIEAFVLEMEKSFPAMGKPLDPIGWMRDASSPTGTNKCANASEEAEEAARRG